MTDIVKRLREPPFGTETSERNLMNAAADEIERLRAALTPFASIKADVGDGFSGLPDTVIVRIEASVRELKAARAALEGAQDADKA